MSNDLHQGKSTPKKLAASAKRTKRVETKGEATRLRLLRAAAKVIAQHGYLGCSIARITDEANVAHGTFYFHFPSQQALFDEILPSLLQEMLDQAAEAFRGSKGITDLEHRGIEFTLDYMLKNPYMYRLLTQSEAHVPEAFQQQMTGMLGGYAQSLKRSLEAGEIRGYDEEEMHALAAILLGAKTYLMMKWRFDKDKDKNYRKKMIKTYLKFVRYGINAEDETP